MGYLFLSLAILFEVAATTALKASEAFTKLLPSTIVVVGYGAAFYFLSLALKSVPVGIAYAIWAGLGIVLITIAGAVAFKQRPDLAAIIGMSLIISGVLVIHLFSDTATH